MERITSLTNNKIKNALKLKEKKYRRKEKKFLVEGYHLVKEAALAGVLLETFSSKKEDGGVWVTEEIIKKLSDAKTPQPIVGVCEIKNKEVKGNKILLLDNIQDPGNVGTLIRSALAFSWDGIVIKGVEIYSPKVVRSSQGAIFKLPIQNIKDTVEHLKDCKLPVIGATLTKDAIDYQELKDTSKMMLIIGNEGNGITDEVMKVLDKKVYIPIKFESLNAAVAGSILMNEYK